MINISVENMCLSTWKWLNISSSIPNSSDLHKKIWKMKQSGKCHFFSSDLKEGLNEPFSENDHGK